MTPEQWQRGVFWLIAVSGAVAFVLCLLLIALQPRGVSKWFTLCLGWIFACLGTVCILGAWQHSARGGHAIWSDGRFLPGAGLWLAGMIVAAAGWRVNARRSAALGNAPEDDASRACERHARSINVLALTGAAGAIVLIVVLMRVHWDGVGPAWQMAAIALVAQVPALLRSFVFLPRCVVCGAGRMKITRWRPAGYHCQACGATRATDINIANTGNHG